MNMMKRKCRTGSIISSTSPSANARKTKRAPARGIRKYHQRSGHFSPTSVALVQWASVGWTWSRLEDDSVNFPGGTTVSGRRHHRVSLWRPNGKRRLAHQRRLPQTPAVSRCRMMAIRTTARLTLDTAMRFC